MSCGIPRRKYASQPEFNALEKENEQLKQIQQEDSDYIRLLIDELNEWRYKCKDLREQVVALSRELEQLKKPYNSVQFQKDLEHWGGKVDSQYLVKIN